MRLLDVYYVIHYKEKDMDEELIGRCLEVFIKVNTFNQFLLNKCQRVYYNNGDDDDVIKNGFNTFLNMYDKLKLKNHNPTWFVYVSHGNVLNMYQNVDLILLNKNPSVKECFYSINRNPMCLETLMPRHEKLRNIKVFKESLEYITTQTKCIKYNKFFLNV